MSAIQIAAPGSGNGTTAGATVVAAGTYVIQATWDGVGSGPTVTPQVSVDGTNYFPIGSGTTSPLSLNLSATSTTFAYRLTDFPIVGVRLVVAGLTTGTYGASVISL